MAREQSTLARLQSLAAEETRALNVLNGAAAEAEATSQATTQDLGDDVSVRLGRNGLVLLAQRAQRLCLGPVTFRKLRRWGEKHIGNSDGSANVQTETETPPTTEPAHD